MFTRSLQLPAAGTETFFLWGPRQTGKTTLLRRAYPDAVWLDLLKADEFRRYLDRPELLRQELAARPARQVVIDEIQKVPHLLDEVHWLIENTASCTCRRTAWSSGRSQGSSCSMITSRRRTPPEIARQ